MHNNSFFDKASKGVHFPLEFVQPTTTRGAIDNDSALRLLVKMRQNGEEFHERKVPRVENNFVLCFQLFYIFLLAS